ncbi:MAG TPA: CAP domain-containing protein [Polyangiaceae bacterium]|nr:CAP domain-containing protein [Polyangiaceae bacterium]
MQPTVGAGSARGRIEGALLSPASPGLLVAAVGSDDMPGTSDAEFDQQQCRAKRLDEPAWEDEVVMACMVREHQRARARPEISPPLAALVWSPTLAKAARRWVTHLAERCQGLEHERRVRYGQNLAARSSIAEDSRFAPASVIDGWLAEAQCWTPGKIGVSDRCDTACVGRLNSSGCGHFTQLVWRATRTVGCAYATCRREGFLDEYWVCNYDPAGNVRGRSPY